MGRGKCRALAVMACLVLGMPAQADAEIAGIDAIGSVMTGSSSSGNDQVWVKVQGQPAGVSSSCVWNGVSLFYVAGDGGLNGDKAMAALLSARLSGTRVTLAYTVMGGASDFWGFGITSCRIDRISVGN